MVGFAILVLGVIYWFGFAKVVPRLAGYKLVVERETLTDGNEVVRYKKIRVIDIVSNGNPLVPVEDGIEKVV